MVLSFCNVRGISEPQISKPCWPSWARGKEAGMVRRGKWEGGGRGEAAGSADALRSPLTPAGGR